MYFRPCQQNDNDALYVFAHFNLKQPLNIGRKERSAGVIPFSARAYLMRQWRGQNDFTYSQVLLQK